MASCRPKRIFLRARLPRAGPLSVSCDNMSVEDTRSLRLIIWCCLVKRRYTDLCTRRGLCQ
jgi:hypothetical protein